LIAAREYSETLVREKGLKDEIDIVYDGKEIRMLIFHVW
jgi:hypothetical protein